MYLRKLELKDAPLMLEWMHNREIISDLNQNFLVKNIVDAEKFIEASWNSSANIHLAIASDIDEYMGTVSLKNIDDENKSAEFGIAVRQCAMGHGYSWFGMKSILEKAFSELNLESVYWCVEKKNQRAVRFYEKHHFHEAVDISQNILARYKETDSLKWYSVLKGDNFADVKEVAGCKVIHINTIPTVSAGELSFFEGIRDVPFDIKRIYYISKVPEGIRRGFHAHKKLKQILFCPYGRIQLVLDNGSSREEIELSDPSVGILIEQPVWREMLWIQKNSVLCVAASDFYDENDYIRNYHEFNEYIHNKNI